MANLIYEVLDIVCCEKAFRISYEGSLSNAHNNVHLQVIMHGKRAMLAHHTSNHTNCIIISCNSHFKRYLQLKNSRTNKIYKHHKNNNQISKKYVFGLVITIRFANESLK